MSKKFNTNDVIGSVVQKPQPKDVYPFIIDCSLDKKGNMLVYELQPLVYSGLWTEALNKELAFEKAFPEISFEINYKSFQYVSEKKDNKMLISDKFSEGACLEYLDTFKYVHAAPHAVLNQLCNKTYQRLYLPPDVSPEYILFDLSLDRDKEIKRVVSYFREKNINKIVLKHPDAFEGNGNVFIDDAQSEEAIKQGIEKLSQMKGAATDKQSPCLLVESQSAFSRINGGTGEKKPDFAVYRIVGIADENGSLGYFILAKLISPHVDSQHHCYTLKFYSDKKTERPSRFFSRNNGHFIEYRGPKDKYFNLGVDKTLLEKTFISAYKLYHDLGSMTDSDFKNHIDSLILSKKENENIDQAKKSKEPSARQEKDEIDIEEPTPDVEARSRRMTL